MRRGCSLIGLVIASFPAFAGISKTLPYRNVRQGSSPTLSVVNIEETRAHVLTDGFVAGNAEPVSGSSTASGETTTSSYVFFGLLRQRSERSARRSFGGNCGDEPNGDGTVASRHTSFTMNGFVVNNSVLLTAFAAGGFGAAQGGIAGAADRLTTSLQKSSGPVLQVLEASIGEQFMCEVMLDEIDND